MHLYRTHTCNQIRATDAGATAKLSGWIFRVRDHGGILFIDLRDHYGVTQVVIHPSRPFFEALSHAKLETVITVTGEVTVREPSQVNPEIPTGEVELVANECIIEAASEQMPLYLPGEEDGAEEVRLKYRFLDLRRERIHGNIVLRSKVIAFLRKAMEAQGFNEYQTPILTCSSPEGARDYLVPSRVHHGKFYALPQAPQLFKQLLMVAGFDRYFQIAPCFRDEDARADRSPGEFYQLDMEMSFVTQDDVFAVVEDVVSKTFAHFSKKAVDATPWIRIPFREAMLKYGTDKPDLRIPIEMFDCSGVFETSGFNAFAAAVKSGAVVRAIPVKGIKDKPRSFFDKLVEHAKGLGSKGLAYLVWDGDTVKGPIQKFLTPDELAALAQMGGMTDGDVLFFVCEAADKAAKIAGDIRVKLGRDLELIDPNVFRFCWIVDFPMFETDPETGAVAFSHNPFSMPQGGMDALLSKDPLDVLAYQYDAVCNGIELSSGAIRNHLPEIMYKAFEIAGYGPEVVEQKFGCLLNAFKFGAPPHGGIAPGVDRMVMLLAGEDNIREVIAFPMNQKAQDLMMNAPSDVTEKQLRELHIKVRGKDIVV
ncbi:MAG: aspartate--tRNA ligase [Kiritimatiellaeota bacterium]|nr:aspartate--tRNA ligase [Kiritimatiellota bacterium]